MGAPSLLTPGPGSLWCSCGRACCPEAGHLLTATRSTLPAGKSRTLGAVLVSPPPSAPSGVGGTLTSPADSMGLMIPRVSEVSPKDRSDDQAVDPPASNSNACCPTALPAGPPGRVAGIHRGGHFISESLKALEMSPLVPSLQPLPNIIYQGIHR